MTPINCETAGRSHDDALRRIVHQAVQLEDDARRLALLLRANFYDAAFPGWLESQITGVRESVWMMIEKAEERAQ